MSVFDAVFVAVCKPLLDDIDSTVSSIELEKLDKLRGDEQFMEAAQSRTTGRGNVELRINKATDYLS